MLPWNRKFQVAPPATQTVNSKKPLNLERCNELVEQLSKETFSKNGTLFVGRSSREALRSQNTAHSDSTTTIPLAPVRFPDLLLPRQGTAR